MRRSSIAAVLALLIAGCGDAPATPVPAAARAPLTCGSIDELFALPADELDLGAAALLLSKELDPAVDVAAGLAELDRLGAALRRDIRPDMDAEARAWALVEQLAAVEGFGSAEDALEPRGRLLSAVLDERVGNCIGLSALYAAVGQRAGLDVSLVLIPYHVFVRVSAHDRSADVEPTIGGLYPPGGPRDAWYVSEADRDSGRWCRSLGGREAIAFLTIDFTLELLDLEQNERALALARAATELGPELVAGWGTYATALARAERFDEARAAFERALGLAPGDADLHAQLARFELVRERPAWAVVGFERALAIDPQFPVYHLEHAEALYVLERYEEALEALERARAVQWTQLHPNRRFGLRQAFPTRKALEAEVFRQRWVLHSARAEQMAAQDELFERVEDEHAALVVELRTLAREVALAELAKSLFFLLSDIELEHDPLATLEATTKGLPEVSGDPAVVELVEEVEALLARRDALETP